MSKRKNLRKLIAMAMVLAVAFTSISMENFSHVVNGKENSTKQEATTDTLTADQKEEIKRTREEMDAGLKKVQKEKKENQKAKVVKELKKLRTANSTTYLLSDGSKKLEIYGADIRYKENGKYYDFDPTLKRISDDDSSQLSEKTVNLKDCISKEYAYVNTAGNTKHYFPKELSKDDFVLLTKKAYAISFAPMDIKTTNDGIAGSIKDTPKEKKTEIVTENDKEVTEDGTDETGKSEENESFNAVKETEEKTRETDTSNKQDEKTEDVTEKETEFSKDEERPDENTLYLGKNSVFENTITYQSKNSNASYKYTSLTNGVKEEIILNNKQDDNVFEFQLNLPGMEVLENEYEKEIRIVNQKSKKLIAYISEPSITDAGGNISYGEIQYEIEKSTDGCYVFKVVVDKEYLNSEKTKYPISVDPTVYWTNTVLQSAMVSSFPYTVDDNFIHTDTICIHNKGMLYGYHATSEDLCYIDTSGIDKNNPIIGSSGTFYGSNVTSAYLSITEKSNTYNIGASGTGTFVSGHIEVRTPTATWKPNQITWTNHPSMGSDVWEQFQCSGVANTTHNVEVTEWAQEVADRNIVNTGLALKAVEEGTGANFYSSSSTNGTYAMKLTIVYEDPHVGEKDIYSYEEFDTANGSGKIELSEGNLLYAQEDFSLPTPQLALGITRTYNSRYTGITSFGIGWSCEYDSRFVDLKNNRAVYVDGTGAFYGFERQNNGTYTCDENTDLSLEIGLITQNRTIDDGNTTENVRFSSYFIITDKDDVKRYFDGDGLLCLIEEPNGTFVYIKRDRGNNYIEYVKSSQGKEITFENITSDDNYLIKKATLPDGSYFSYNYTDDRLTGVVHKGTDNGEITYQYEYNTDGQLSKITDALGNYFTVTYDNKSVLRVTYSNGEKIDVYTNYQPLKTRTYTKSPNGVVLTYYEYEFDTSGKVLKKTNDIGNETNYTYDGSLITNTEEKVQYHKLLGGNVYTVTPSGTSADPHLEESIEYNARDNIYREVDEEGNITVYTYGDNNHPDLETKVKVTSASGDVIEETDYEYDSEGNLIKETDYIEKTVTTYTYDANGNETENVETLVDADANMSNVSQSVIDNGLTNSIEEETCDIDGNETENSLSSGTIAESETCSYDSMGKVISSVDEKNITTQYSYDEFGRTTGTTTTIPGKQPEATATSYDSNGRVLSETDRHGRVTTYQYDNMGRVTSKTLSYNNDSRTTTTTYGFVENFYVYTGTGTNKLYSIVSVTTEKNANNEIVSRSYYDPYGSLVREESLGICNDYTYDKQGNVFTTYSRGTDGDLTSVAPKLTVTVYDQYGRLTDTIQNAYYRNGKYCADATYSIVTSNTYDADGNLIQEKDGRGNTTSYEYDEEGRITKVTLPDTTNGVNETQYAYDIQNEDLTTGKILSTTDTVQNALGNISETTYNGAGQILSVTDKKTGGDIVTSYRYDASGNMTRQTLSSGCYITYNYNSKNLPTSRSEMSSNNTRRKYTNYTYDADDQLIKTRDCKIVNYQNVPFRYTFYEYDDFGRMTGYAEINASSEPSASVINAHKTTYTYDIEDKITEIRYPQTANDKLKGVQFEYNDYKWLTNIKGIISENNEEVIRNIRSYEYYNDSKIKTIKDYRGFLTGTNGYIKKDYTYDVFDRVTDMEYTDSSNANAILEKHSYAYDKNSNILTETYINNYPQTQSEKVNETRTYTYDNLNRLKTSKVTNNTDHTEKNTSYSYDKVGNCTRVVEDGITTYNTYNELNQLTQSVVFNSTSFLKQTLYEYDENGNQTYEQTLDNTSTVTESVYKSYDINNRLTYVEQADGDCYDDGTITAMQANTYTADGKRVQRTDDTNVTNFYYQGDVLLYTTDEDGDKLCQNIIGPQDNIIATIHYDNGQHAYFYNKDIRTSVTNIVDESGNGVVSYQYDDYGTTTKYGNTGFYNEICYTSGVYDETTGLYYLKARYYDPEDQIFMTQDTYQGEQDDPISLNMYAYCGGNPINYVDPSGHFAIAIGAIYYVAIGVIAAAATYVTVKHAPKVIKVGTQIIINNIRYRINAIVRAKRSLKKAIRRRIHQVRTKGNENQRDTGLIGVLDQEIKQKLKDPHTSKKEKQRLRREQKARKQRNKNKNRSKNKSKK